MQTPEHDSSPSAHDEFYYPGNPLLKECLWQSREVAVWSRSREPLPADYPRSASGEGGILFLGRQARGTHELPFAIAVHAARGTDRERESYYDFQVVDALAGAVRGVPAAASAALLQAASLRWSVVRKKPYECGSWEPVVELLARNVASDPATAAQWRARNPWLLAL
ncbi:MAG: hypothetical protein HY901_22325 [Deltaproteobacteria bacterium]|nr:hypothetical protein [Deltaproteobacteria bacterium]